MIAENELRKYSLRILHSRMRLLQDYPFFGMMLMHMKFDIDESIDTACTDGDRISFSPAFMNKLSDSELEFVLMHEVMHVALLHCTRGLDYDSYIFNIACDIVVNSNILKACDMDTEKITLKAFGESMHIAPDGREGYLYTAEEVYKMLTKNGKPKQRKSGASGNGNGGTGNKNGSDSGNKKGSSGPQGSGDDGDWDNHSRWGTVKRDEFAAQLASRVMAAEEALKIQHGSNARGAMPLGIERLLDKLRNPVLDWREILQNFLYEDIFDYTFSPPDRRFSDGDFYLPDYNVSDEAPVARDVLFMIDASGSMSDQMLADCYSEVASALDQFEGRLCGWLGFFDGDVVPPVRFDTVEEFKVIKPRGGGGTNFHCIFEYVEKHLFEKPPSNIVILTDGYAPFPDEKAAAGIPTLWIINNDKIKPPFGKIARI